VCGLKSTGSKVVQRKREADKITVTKDVNKNSFFLYKNIPLWFFKGRERATVKLNQKKKGTHLGKISLNPNGFAWKKPYIQPIL
jgi:hypothetical protein